MKFVKAKENFGHREKREIKTLELINCQSSKECVSVVRRGGCIEEEVVF